ncbi:YIP1 family protein [Pseudoduganella sp. SL102]|uniref:YIP1 family protein n=1 Tax=Pseudoduganella sp. SL102 TaxID=2995154 RepID=UPI00248C818C|nr:YIP1 family protein [Pseudoduganella sp. SL102]WBS00276.1 YIP1 family protein [Pseudoduganella sp. SL102]
MSPSRSMNPGVADLGRILYEPGAVFAGLKARHSAWLPLLAFLALQSAVAYWWVATADFAWQREQMTAGVPGLAPQGQAALETTIAPTPMMITLQLGLVFGTLAAYAVQACYFLVAGKALDADVRLRQWFAFVSWVNVPKLLVLPLMALQIAVSDGRVTLEDLNLASLASLLRMDEANPWHGLAAGLDFTTVWSIVLATIGLRVWTGCGARAAAVTAVLPYAVIYGVWAAWIVLFS